MGVIVMVNCTPISTVVEGVETTIAPTTAGRKGTKEVVEKRFGGECATEKTQSFKQPYRQLEIHCEVFSQEDVKGTSSSSTNTQNIAFVSSNSTSSTNGVINTAHGAITASTQATAVNSTTINNLSDAVICAFFVGEAILNLRSKRFSDEHWKEFSGMVSDNEKDDVPQAKIKKKTFKPSFAKIEFVKSKQQEKIARKIVNHVEQNRQNIHTPRGNQSRLKPALGFLRPFGCPVTIHNTIDHLGKFDGKADEGFFVGYLINSKAFRVFNSRTMIVEENLHVQFSENTPNIVGSTKACDDAGKARMEILPSKDYILLPLWTVDPPFSQILKSSPDAGFKPSCDEGKKVDENSRNSLGIDQEKEDNVNNTNNVDAANTNEVNAICGKTSIELPDDPNVPSLEDIVYSDDDEDFGTGTDMNNLDAFMPASLIPTTKEETKKVIHALKDPSWIEAMQEELLQFKLVAQGYTQEEGIDYDEVFSLVARIEAIRLFLAYASFKDFVVYQMDVKSAFLYGKIEEEVYVCQQLGFEDPDFPDRVYKVEKALSGLHKAPRACQDKYVIEILKKFVFTDVKTASTPIETQKLLLNDEDDEEVDVHLYRSMIGSLMYLTSSRPVIMFALCQPKLGLWYPKDSPFDLVAYTDSDYAGASLDRKTITGGCQFLGCRLISWQCKKQTVVSNSTTKAEYVDALSCFG
ncbi:retrovirus-related pol polyprotein from transposon TNT 1-94 [Tanacetum coccineum]